MSLKKSIQRTAKLAGKYAKGGSINIWEKQKEWYGNRELGYESYRKFFSMPRTGRKIPVFIYGTEKKGWNYVVSAGANSDSSYSGGFPEELRHASIEKAKEYVDKLYDDDKLIFAKGGTINTNKIIVEGYGGLFDVKECPKDVDCFIVDDDNISQGDPYDYNGVEFTKTKDLIKKIKSDYKKSGKKYAIVTVYGGVADKGAMSKGVDVEIVDHDNDEEAMDTGGKIDSGKDRNIAINMAMAYLAMAKQKMENWSVGYRQITKLINELKTNSKDSGTVNMAILYLKNFSDEYATAGEKEKIKEIIERIRVDTSGVIKLTSKQGKEAKKKWDSMSISERYNWLKHVYDFPEIDNHGTAAQNYNEIPNEIKMSLITGKPVFSIENDDKSMADGGSMEEYKVGDRVIFLESSHGTYDGQSGIVIEVFNDREELDVATEYIPEGILCRFEDVKKVKGEGSASFSEGGTPLGSTTQTHIPTSFKKGGTIYDDTLILPEVVADTVANEKISSSAKTKNLPLDDKRHRIEKALAKDLVRKANKIYENNAYFRKKLDASGNKGRDALYVYMRHWADAWIGGLDANFKLKKEYKEKYFFSEGGSPMGSTMQTHVPTSFEGGGQMVAKFYITRSSNGYEEIYNWEKQTFEDLVSGDTLQTSFDSKEEAEREIRLHSLHNVIVVSHEDIYAEGGSPMGSTMQEHIPTSFEEGGQSDDGEILKTLREKDEFANGGKTKKNNMLHEGTYLRFQTKGNHLVVNLTDEGKEWVKENGRITYDNFNELFEDIQGNSELMYFSDLGEAGLGLTSAPGITDGYSYNDEGELVGHADAKLWYYDNYAIRDPFEKLSTEGEVTFGGRFHSKYAVGGSPMGSTMQEHIPTSFEEGGTPLGSTMQTHIPTSFKDGGETVSIVRVPNTEASHYAQNTIPFKGNNLEGKILDNGDYAVLSFGIYPIWYWCGKEKKWFGNADKYCQATSLHISQSRPDWNAQMFPLSEFLEKIKSDEARFAFGGTVQSMMNDIGSPAS